MCLFFSAQQKHAKNHWGRNPALEDFQEGKKREIEQIKSDFETCFLLDLSTHCYIKLFLVILTVPIDVQRSEVFDGFRFAPFGRRLHPQHTAPHAEAFAFRGLDFAVFVARSGHVLVFRFGQPCVRHFTVQIALVGVAGFGLEYIKATKSEEEEEDGDEDKMTIMTK